MRAGEGRAGEVAHLLDMPREDWVNAQGRVRVGVGVAWPSPDDPLDGRPGQLLRWLACTHPWLGDAFGRRIPPHGQSYREDEDASCKAEADREVIWRWRR